MRGKVEDSFRYMAFLEYYRMLRDECPDLTVRLATAVVRSARQVNADEHLSLSQKESLIVKWWKDRRSK